MRDNLFTRLPLKDRHNKCTRCNRCGCTRDSLWSHLRFQAWLARQDIRKAVRAWIRSWSVLDYNQIDDVQVAGIDTRDYPDFCDAYIESASYMGREMTEAELERLNEDSAYVYAAVENHIY